MRSRIASEPDDTPAGGVLNVASVEIEGRDVAYGGVTGLAAWVIGYVFTYVIAAPDLQDTLGRVIEAIQGEPATYNMVGWVFYNAHFVQTVTTGIPFLSPSSTSFIGGENGFPPLLYVLPVALLLAAGIAMARLHGASDFGDGVIAGLLVVPGYLVASIAGALLLGIDIGDVTIAPDLMTAIVLAGIAYPVVLGGAGGALAAATSSD